jgi:hypothetical protein
MPYMEILSLLGGGLAGFIFRMMAQNAADKQAQFEMLIKTIKAQDESADSAAKRTPNDKAGNWIRRVIVLSILFGVVLAPFILAVAGKPIIVEVSTPVKTWFGILPTGGKTKFYELGSYLLVPEVRQSLMAIIGYYFGQSAAKR